MRAPFLTLTWARAHAEGAAAAARFGEDLMGAGWRRRRDQAGLAVWDRPERPVPLAGRADGEGLVVGRWFGPPSAPHPAPHPVDGRAPAVDRARALCRGGWGAYAALLHDPSDGGWRVFRDPSGAIDVFTWAVGPIQATASGLRRVPPRLWPARMGLDWTVIADMVARPASRSAGSALADIHAVAPGVLQRAGASATGAQVIWRPQDWSAFEDGPDPAWPERVRGTLETVAGKLAGSYARLATEASGGLDSSIVNVALSRAGLAGRVAGALHYLGDRSEADERRWAERLCARSGAPLVVVGRATAARIDPQRDFAALARDVRPPFGALDAARDRDTAARLRVGRVEALVTGKGGDALFFQMPSVRVVSDLWRAQGLRAIRHPLNAEVARWLRRSVWSVWRDALSDRPPEMARAVRFGGQALRTAPASPAHPWLSDLEAATPAKQAQILALATSLSSQATHRRGRVADIVQPLLSQPMMELCLATPAWALVRGGRDRALAREAFAPWLPETIVHRRSKGALSSLYARRAAASAPALREHLLDGVLANAGILDRRAVAAALEPDQLIRRLDGVDLIAAAALESWVRYWQTRAPDAATGKRWRP